MWSLFEDIMAFRARSEISLYVNPDTSISEVAPNEAEMMDTEQEVDLKDKTF